MAGGRAWYGREMDQDWVDSANGFWSVLLLATCSVGSLLIRYVSDPISCFTPLQFESQHVTYAESTCFTKEMFLMLQNTSVVDTRDMDPTYHLWVPLILLVQALCFKIPNIIWNIVKPSVTFNLEATVTSLEYAQVANVEARQTVRRQAGNVIGGLLKRKKFTAGMLYLFVKVMYCLNLCGQFVFLTVHFRQFLAIKASNYIGLDISSHLQPLMQRKVLCEFHIRQIQNIHSYSVQCELAVVDMYEKLFVFLWYCILLLMVVTFFSLLLWAGFLFIPFFRDSRISACIKASPDSSQDYSHITQFISGFLGIDGVLMLSMISRNSNVMIATDLSQQLYQMFLAGVNQTSVSGKPGNPPAVSITGPEDDIAMEELSSPVDVGSSTKLLDES